MITAFLIRTYHDDCTEGALMMLDDAKILTTCNILELPNKENKQRISCIPEGEYEVVPHTSPKFGRCFWVKNVENREGILIHGGNTVDDIKGCLLPGIRQRKGFVGSSKNTLSTLIKLAPKGFKLKIVSQ